MVVGFLASKATEKGRGQPDCLDIDSKRQYKAKIWPPHEGCGLRASRFGHPILQKYACQNYGVRTWTSGDILIPIGILEARRSKTEARIGDDM